VSEHLPAGSAVITVIATDRDSGENGKINYRVMSSTRGVFYIDPSNGEVTVCTFIIDQNTSLTRALLNYPSYKCYPLRRFLDTHLGFGPIFNSLCQHI